MYQKKVVSNAVNRADRNGQDNNGTLAIMLLQYTLKEKEVACIIAKAEGEHTNL